MVSCASSLRCVATDCSSARADRATRDARRDRGSGCGCGRGRRPASVPPSALPTAVCLWPFPRSHLQAGVLLATVSHSRGGCADRCTAAAAAAAAGAHRRRRSAPSGRAARPGQAVVLSQRHHHSAGERAGSCMCRLPPSLAHQSAPMVMPLRGDLHPCAHCRRCCSSSATAAAGPWRRHRPGCIHAPACRAVCRAGPLAHLAPGWQLFPDESATYLGATPPPPPLLGGRRCRLASSLLSLLAP